jgi:hypothetical protein
VQPRGACADRAPIALQHFGGVGCPKTPGEGRARVASPRGATSRARDRSTEVVAVLARQIARPVVTQYAESGAAV